MHLQRCIGQTDELEVVRVAVVLAQRRDFCPQRCVVALVRWRVVVADLAVVQAGQQHRRRHVLADALVDLAADKLAVDQRRAQQHTLALLDGLGFGAGEVVGHPVVRADVFVDVTLAHAEGNFHVFAVQQRALVVGGLVIDAHAGGPSGADDIACQGDADGGTDTGRGTDTDRGRCGDDLGVDVGHVVGLDGDRAQRGQFAVAGVCVDTARDEVFGPGARASHADARRGTRANRHRGREGDHVDLRGIGRRDRDVAYRCVNNDIVDRGLRMAVDDVARQAHTDGHGHPHGAEGRGNRGRAGEGVDGRGVVGVQRHAVGIDRGRSVVLAVDDGSRINGDPVLGPHTRASRGHTDGATNGDGHRAGEDQRIDALVGQ